MEGIYERFYVDVRTLKNAFEKLSSQGSIQDFQAAAKFGNLASDEIRKVNQFATLKHQELCVEMQVTVKNIKCFLKLLGDKRARDNSKSPITAESCGSPSSRSAQPFTKTEQELFCNQTQDALNDISKDIVHLHRFVRLNFTLLVKASLYFDKLFDTSLSPWFTAQLLRESFATLDVDLLLIMLSLCWEKYRQMVAVIQNGGKSSSDETGPWKPPESFVRTTTKYWLRPDKVAAAKAFIVKYVPYLLFGYSSDDLEFLIDPFDLAKVRPRAPHEIKEGQLVSSIYLDSEGGHSYYERLRRLEGAELIRCRWYGENKGEPYTEIFVERKTHHEGWSGDKSTKERFCLPQKRIFQFLKGDIDIPKWARSVAASKGVPMENKKIQNIIRLGEEISTTIKRHRLQPMVRTSYLRSAFQAADNNDVRFSLDINLCMVNEFQPDNHPNPPWCRVSEEILGKDEVVRFPFSVLEVKLQGAQPSWVSAMLNDSEAMMVYKFSKFQHGMAFLHRDKVAHYGLPHWIPDFESRGFVPGFSIPPSRNLDTSGGPMMSMTDKLGHTNSSYATSPYLRSRAALVRPSRCTSSGAKFSVDPQRSTFRSVLLSSFYPDHGNRTDIRKDNARHGLIFKPTTETDILAAIHSRAKIVRKLDPKSILASERNLLHYIQKFLFVTIVAVVLVQLSQQKHMQQLGVVLAVCALCGIIASYYVYEIRTNKINSRMTKAILRNRLDNMWAPVVTCGLVSVSLVVIICVNMRAA